MLTTQPLEILDFSKGLTEHIFSQDARAAGTIDNFFILPNKTIQSRGGSEIDDLTNGQIPVGAQRIGTLINYDNSTKIFVQSAKKIYYRNPSAYATLQGPTGNDVFSLGDANSIVSYAQWNKHIFITSDAYPRPMKIFKDNAGVYQVRSSGLPDLASAPIVTAGAAGARNYLYAFHFFFQYQVNNETFQDFGPITPVELNNSGDPFVNPNSITGIPVLSNGATDNWDTATIKIYIYRTVDAGTTFFKIGEVTNGTTTFNDNFSDASISNNELLYTSDGSLDNAPPPLAKFVHIINNIGYYAYIKSGSEIFPFKIQQSNPFDPDSVPTPFEDSVEDEITGLSSVQSIPIVLCKKHIYRIEGQFDAQGRGFMSHVRISDTAGCISNQSVVQAENGLFWAGNDGFYYSDGYTVTRIFDEDQTYKSMVQNSTNVQRIVGVFDDTNRRVIWTVQFNSSSLDNDACFVLDLRQGLSSESSFVTLSGGTSFAPTSAIVFNRVFYRSDKRGYVFKHTDGILTDPVVDTSILVAFWNTQPVIYNYTSIAFNFGSNFLRKWVPRMLLTAKNLTNVSIQINAINDDGRARRPLKEIRWRKNFVWGDTDFVWGDPNCSWAGDGLIEQWRRFPAKNLRLSYLQVEITNAYTVVTNSDTIGKATFNGTTNQATLDDAAASDWPIDCVGYYLSTEADGYTKQYLITVRSADTVTLLDAQNTLPSGDFKWEMKGFKKNEALNLLAYTLHWANISKSQATFETGQDGGNA